MQWQQRKAKEVLRESDCNAVLLYGSEELPDENIHYLTGLPKRLHGPMALLLTSTGGTLYANPLEAPVVKATLKNKSLNVETLPRRSEMLKTLRGVLQNRRAVGINTERLTLAHYRKMQDVLKGKRVRDVSGALGNARAVKSEEEISHIRRAVKVTLDIVERIPERLGKGVTEASLKNWVEDEMRARGCVPAYETIVAFGANSATPHHVSTERELRKGDIVLVDAGAEHANYAADLTRCWVHGRASKRQRETYSLVWEAKRASETQARSGVEARQLHGTAASVLAKAGHAMIHSLGHGLGLRVHDYPERMNEKASWRLAKGHVLTMEPGVYVPGCDGIRLEDDIVIDAKKALPLSKCPAELIEV